MTDVAAAELYERLAGPAPPRILDVRNTDEFLRWRVERPHPVDVLNVPYFEFVEREEAAAKRVIDWLGSAQMHLVVVCAEGGSSAYVAEILQGRDSPPPTSSVAWSRGARHRDPARRLGRTGPALAGSPLRTWVPVVRGRRGQRTPSSSTRTGDSTPTAGSSIARGSGSARCSTPTFTRTTSPAGRRSPATPGWATTRACATSRAEPSRSRTWSTAGPCGSAWLEVLPIVPLGTPGHTPGSTSLLVADALLLTGDTLFVDDVGRPDLGGQAAAWARDLYQTLHERLRPLGDAIVVLPAHASTVATSGPLGDGLQTPPNRPIAGAIDLPWRPKGNRPRPRRVAPRLYLVSPQAADPAGLADALARALAAADVAAVLLRLAAADERTHRSTRSRRSRRIVQDRGAALLLDGHPELAARAGADGAHLDGLEAVPGRARDAQARPHRRLRRARQPRTTPCWRPRPAPTTSCSASPTRRAAGPPSTRSSSGWPGGRRCSRFPASAYAASLDEVEPLAAAGADFVAVGDCIFGDARGCAAALADAARRLAVAETVA